MLASKTCFLSGQLGPGLVQKEFMFQQKRQVYAQLAITEAACDKFEGHPVIGELRTEKNFHWGLFLVVDQG